MLFAKNLLNIVRHQFTTVTLTPTACLDLAAVDDQKKRDQKRREI